MKVKFNLSKFARVSDIDDYPFFAVMMLTDIYQDYLKANKGTDIEFPQYKLDKDGKGERQKLRR